MVGTRTTSKRVTKAVSRKSSTPKRVVSKKSKQAFNRCSNWIQSQKKEKPKCTVDDLDSDETDDEVQNIRLESTSQNQKEQDVTKVYLACEWQRCNTVFETYKEIQLHVSKHCVVFKRHVLYHVYITNLKTIGEQLLYKRPMPPCLNDSRRRNLIPDIESKYVCMWRDCTYTFELAQDYFDHARNHCIYEIEVNKQGNRNSMVQCNWSSCKKQFNKRLKMIEHMRSHTGERFVACSNCGSTFNSYTKFYDHFRRQASGNYKYSECLHSFNTEELLNNHMNAHINRHKCTMCDMTCPSPAALTQHFRYRHLKEKPYKCTECDYAAVTKYDLNKHISRMHSDEQFTYFCEEFECEYSCLSMNLMRKHSRNVHGDGPNIYSCYCCSSHYRNGTSLSKHLIKHHGFQLPSGHRRCTYRIDMDGMYRVQTTRMESLEVSEQIMAPPMHDTTNTKNITYALSEFQETPNGLSITVIEKEKPESNEMQHSLNETQETVSSSDPETEVDKNEIQTIDSNTFMECLNLKQLLPSDKIEVMRTSDVHVRQLESIEIDDDLKNIENFSVIKKYAKKKRQKNRITLTVEDIDEDGNVLRSETRNITESEFNRIKNS